MQMFDSLYVVRESPQMSNAPSYETSKKRKISDQVSKTESKSKQSTMLAGLSQHINRTSDNRKATNDKNNLEKQQALARLKTLGPEAEEAVLQELVYIIQGNLKPTRFTKYWPYLLTMRYAALPVGFRDLPGAARLLATRYSEIMSLKNGVGWIASKLTPEQLARVDQAILDVSSMQEVMGLVPEVWNLADELQLLRQAENKKGGHSATLFVTARLELALAKASRASVTQGLAGLAPPGPDSVDCGVSGADPEGGAVSGPNDLRLPSPSEEEIEQPPQSMYEDSVSQHTSQYLDFDSGLTDSFFL